MMRLFSLVLPPQLGGRGDLVGPRLPSVRGAPSLLVVQWVPVFRQVPLTPGFLEVPEDRLGPVDPLRQHHLSHLYVCNINRGQLKLNSTTECNTKLT